MTMLKRGDSWIHYGFADGRQTNKLQARNVRLSAKGELIVELLHYQRRRNDLSDSDYRLMIMTGAQLASAVIADKTVIQKIEDSGITLTELVVEVSPAVTRRMLIGTMDLPNGFLTR